MPLKPKPISHAAAAKISAKRPWLVVAVQPRREGLFFDQLRHGEFEIYRPMTLVSRDARYVKERGLAQDVTTPAGHRRVLVPEAIFPGYVFLRPEHADYERLSGKPGLLYVMQETLADSVIERMRVREHDGFLVVVQKTNPNSDTVELGDLVRTIDGLLEFVVSETDGRTRVAGLCAFMGGNSKAVVPLHKVELVAKAG